MPCITIVLMLCQCWRGDKCKNISATVDSHGLTKSQPREGNNQPRHQSRYPKPNWHSKSRRLLPIIKLEGSLELTRVLNRLYFCRVGQVHKFPSLWKYIYVYIFIITFLKIYFFLLADLCPCESYYDWCNLQTAPKKTNATFLMYGLQV